NGACPVGLHCSAGLCMADQAEDPTVRVTSTGDGGGVITLPEIGIDCGSSCDSSVDLHAMITLIATPKSGSKFEGWSGVDCAATDCVLVVDNDVTASARFSRTPAPTGMTYSLTVVPIGTGGGIITADVGGISCGDSCFALYGANTVVTLSVSAQAGSTFAGWN